MDDDDGTTAMFVGYTVYQSPSQANEASLKSYFGDAKEEEENGIVLTSLGLCSMMIDSVPVCSDGIPFSCDETYYGCLPNFDIEIIKQIGSAKFVAYKEKLGNFLKHLVRPPPLPPTPVLRGSVACLPAGGMFGGVSSTK